MTGTFTLTPSDLTADFIESIKSLFRGKRIEISVRELTDETDALLSEPANRRHLMESLAQARAGNVVPLAAETL